MLFVSVQRWCRLSLGYNVCRLVRCKVDGLCPPFLRNANNETYAGNLGRLVLYSMDINRHARHLVSHATPRQAVVPPRPDGS